MKHLIIFLIIILGILIVKCSTIETFSDTSEKYVQSEAKLKYSYQIEGRGAFATRDYTAGEIIEVCPSILQKTDEAHGKVRDYLFKYDEEYSMIGFGYCSMYNHSDKENATWHIIDEEKMKIVATKNISKGDEIFVSYGDDYWKTRLDHMDKK